MSGTDAMFDRIAAPIRREGFRLRVLTLFAVVATVGVLPFAAVRFARGDYAVAGIDLFLVAVVAVSVGHAWHAGRMTRPLSLLPVFYTAVVVGLAYYRSPFVVLWLYAVLLANTFVLPRRWGLTLNILAIVSLLPLQGQFESLHFATLIASLLLLMALAAIASALTDERLRAAEDAQRMLRDKTHQLGERVKELACLNQVSTILATSGDAADAAMWRIVETLPPAWQYPEVAVARITLDGHHYATPDFDNSSWRMRQPIMAEDETVGVVEVGYLAARPPADEGPFIKEERDLLNLVAHRIGQIAERQRAREALIDYAARLERYAEDLEQFAFAASHDLLEPLRTVASYTQLLAHRYRRQMSDEADEIVDEVTKAVGRMQALIEGLRAYASIPREPDPSMIEPVSLERALDDALSRLGERLERAEATVTREGPLPTVSARYADVVQVFKGLIDNAVKFRGDRAPVIRVHAAEDGAECIVTVQDNGIGVSPEHAARIFELYKRLHRRDVYPGNGIGLAVCRRIVEYHGGRIWVEPGEQGSLFRFTLPVRAPAE